MVNPTIPQNAIAASRMTPPAHNGGGPFGCCRSTPIAGNTLVASVKLIHAPRTTMSLCAKLMNCRNPSTSVYPSAISAYKLPTESVVIRVCEKSAISDSKEAMGGEKNENFNPAY